MPLPAAVSLGGPPAAAAIDGHHRTPALCPTPSALSGTATADDRMYMSGDVQGGMHQSFHELRYNIALLERNLRTHTDRSDAAAAILSSDFARLQETISRTALKHRTGEMVNVPDAYVAPIKGQPSSSIDTRPFWLVALKTDMQAIFREELSQTYAHRILPALRKDIQAALHEGQSGRNARNIAANSHKQDTAYEHRGHANLEENKSDRSQAESADQGVLLPAELPEPRQHDLRHSVESELRTSEEIHGFSNFEQELEKRELEEAHSHSMLMVAKKIVQVNVSLPDTWLTRLVQSHAFFIAFQIVVFSNAIWLGFCAQKQMHDVNFHNEDAVSVIDMLFTIAFLTETSLKIAGLRLWYFCKGDWAWNWFDLMVVLVSLPKLLLYLMSDKFNALWYDHAQVLRIFRMARILRVFHVLRAVKELRLMVFVLYHTIDTLFWLCVCLLFFTYCFAVVIMQSASMYIEGLGTTQGDKDIADGARSAFGQVNYTMLALFHIISGGDWTDVVKPLEKLWLGYKYFFAAYMFFMMFGMLNVVTGTFCEKAASAVDADKILRTIREQDNREGLITTMHDMFKDMDKEHSGIVEEPEFLAYIDQPFTRNYLSSYGINTFEPKRLFSLIDYVNGSADGTIDATSFVISMLQLVGDARGSDLVLLNKEVNDLKEMLKILLRLNGVALTSSSKERLNDRSP